MAAWVAVGAVVAGLAIAVLRDGEPDVLLPVVEQTELALAADRAHCELRRGSRPARARPRVEGARATPASSGTYRRQQPEASLVGALRRGTIVIQYRPGLEGDAVDRLEGVQAAFPRATIVTPNDDMPYRLAVTGWRRLLACKAVEEETLDAIRLFHGRYVGLGPDVRR